MKHSKHSLALAAAFAGLVGGTVAWASQSTMPADSALSAGMLSAKKKALPKHACKGMNSCKGQGGGDAQQWGRNSCKGQGACATDGSKPRM